MILKKPLKRTKLNKVSKLPLARLKRKADAILSLWVRSRGAVDGQNECYTCKVRYPVAKLQNGHFFSRTHSATRFLENNCRPQCFACNIWKRGNIAVYALRLEEEIGWEKMKELERIKNSIFKLTPSYLENIITTYAI